MKKQKQNNINKKYNAKQKIEEKRKVTLQTPLSFFRMTFYVVYLFPYQNLVFTLLKLCYSLRAIFCRINWFLRVTSGNFKSNKLQKDHSGNKFIPKM